MSSRFHLLLNDVQELFLCSIRLPIPSWAHPHSHGENAMAQGQISAEEGSSPLTQGKQLVHCLSGHLLGLIPTHSSKTPFPSPRLHACQAHPAHARKTWRCSSTVASRAAHPCSRGENISPPVSPPVTMGSSPLTRGKLAHHSPVLPPGGLIPAHAGKTDRSPDFDGRRGAHPR